MGRMSTPTTQVTWYVARNHLGEFSCGRDWVDDLAYARLYWRVGQAKAAATYHAKENPADPVPEVLEWKLDIASATVLNVAIETKRRIARRVRAALDYQMQANQRRLVEIDGHQQQLTEERARFEAVHS